jgi:CBS domain-containing protein
MVRTLNSVTRDDTLENAIDTMHRTEMSVLPVVDEENKFLGTIYGGNILKNIIPEQYGLLESHRLLYKVNQAAENLQEIKNQSIEKYMSKRTSAVKENDRMDNVADIMLDNEESYLYVVNDREKLRGYISRGDLLYYLSVVGEEEE